MVIAGSSSSPFNLIIASSFSPFIFNLASLSASTVGTITVPYGGRNIKIAGERQYADWSTTVMNDEGFIIRNAVEQWIEIINQRTTNFRAFPSEYKTDITVNQYSKKGPPLKIVKLVGCFPTNISEIALDWGSADQIEEYSINWSYDYWE
jgi:hypothetical protein